MHLSRQKTMYGVAAAAALFSATALRPQPPGGGPGWQYCSITGSAMNRAEVCYAAMNGCRREVLSGSNRADAVMAAAAKLGDQGWELIASSESDEGHTLYFKRLKALDNQHPLGN